MALFDSQPRTLAILLLLLVLASLLALAGLSIASRFKRPPESCCRSQATWAVTIGLRGNAMATLVPKVMRLVCSAATTTGR